MAREEIRLDITADPDPAVVAAKYVAKVMDQLEAERTEVEIDADTSGVDKGVRKTKTELGGLNDSADQSRSVLANMTGNVAGDLSSVGGAAGPAGVAIGQMAEYAADGNIKLKSMIGLGAGMVGLAAVMKLLGDRMAKIAAAKAFEKEKVEGWVDALREGADLTDAIVESYREAGKVEVAIGSQQLDITAALDDMGLSVEQFTALVEGSESELAAWQAEMAGAGVDGQTLAVVVAGIESEMSNAEAAARGLGVNTRFFGESAELAAEQQEGLREGMERATDAANEWLDAQLAAVDASFANHDAQRDFARAVEDTREVMADSTHTAEDLENAVRSEREAALDAAAAATRLAEEQARQAGGSLDAEERLDALNASLLESARTATPAARDQLVQYLAEVNGIPVSKATEIVANADTAAAAAELDALADPRTARVTVELSPGNTLSFTPKVTPIPGMGAVGTSSPVTNITVNAPRGMRADDVIAAATRYARRNGGRVLGGRR